MYFPCFAAHILHISFLFLFCFHRLIWCHSISLSPLSRPLPSPHSRRIFSFSLGRRGTFCSFHRHPVSTVLFTFDTKWRERAKLWMNCRNYHTSVLFKQPKCIALGSRYGATVYIGSTVQRSFRVAVWLWTLCHIYIWVNTVPHRDVFFLFIVSCCCRHRRPPFPLASLDNMNLFIWFWPRDTHLFYFCQRNASLWRSKGQEKSTHFAMKMKSKSETSTSFKCSFPLGHVVQTTSDIHTYTHCTSQSICDKPILNSETDDRQ